MSSSEDTGTPGSLDTNGLAKGYISSAGSGPPADEIQQQLSARSCCSQGICADIVQKSWSFVLASSVYSGLVTILQVKHAVRLRTLCYQPV